MANELEKLAAGLKADEPPPEWFSPQALARHLDISLRHLWRLRDGGHLPAPVRLGRLVRWRRAAVEQFLTEAAETGGGRK